MTINWICGNKLQIGVPIFRDHNDKVIIHRPGSKRYRSYRKIEVSPPKLAFNYFVGLIDAPRIA